MDNLPNFKKTDMGVDLAAQVRRYNRAMADNLQSMLDEQGISYMTPVGDIIQLLYDENYDIPITE